MKTLVISEPVLVTGASLQEVKEGLELIKTITRNGNSLIYLTNRPSDCLTPIGGYVNNNGNVSFKYMADKKEALGLKILIADGKDEVLSEILQYNYAIFGNGALIFDELDKIIYERFLEKHVIEETAELLKKNGYDDNPIFAQMANLSFVKYYKSNIGILNKGDCTKIYGLQGYSPLHMKRDIETNEKLCQLLEKANLGLKAWILNNMPCIYNASASKEKALEWLINTKMIDTNDMKLIIGETTDLGLARLYPDLTYAIYSNDDDLKGVRSEKSLVKVLEKF